ncbi:MAG: hypothetical protein V7642_559 [Burkholderiales bacterium]
MSGGRLAASMPSKSKRSSTFSLPTGCWKVWIDIPRFAVAAAGHWWCDEGCRRYRQTHRLLILADAGGSNSCRSRVWKAQLQEQLCDRSGLDVTVCHYLTGCSKWNPIEHRLFSHISLNWAAVPLRSFETVTRYIEGTQTATGLQVKAVLKRGGNGLPAWNYTLHPRHDYSKNNQVIC